MAISPALSALVHHIELNETGWWERASDQLILGVLWLAQKPCATTDIQLHLKSMGIELDMRAIEESVYRLETEGETTSSSGKLILAESATREIETRIKSGEESEEHARAAYDQTLSRHDVLDALPWDQFNQDVLFPLLDDLGAEVYSLLTGSHGGKNPSEVLRPFLDGVDDSVGESLLAAIVDYLDPRRREVREYVLRHLNSAFVARATALTDETLQHIQKQMGSVPQFDVFVDTNFLFSLLALHDNPANDAAEEILRIAMEGSHHVGVALRVLPITLEEARHALVKAQGRCGSLVLRANIGDSLGRVRLGGLEKKFVEQAQKGGTRSARSYFDDVINNLKAMSDVAGIIFHNADTGSLVVNESVATDVVNQFEYERTRPRPKSYEQVQHDIVLWHYARSRRPDYVENPVEAAYWICTADYRFIGYDAHRSDRQRTLPICIDPASLLQILRFWVPMDEGLQVALAGSVRMLFAFQDFDREAERATLRVLEALSRLEDAPYLRAESGLAVVLNRELRRRISEMDDPDEVVELVRSELAQRERELEDQIVQRDTALKKAQEDLRSTQEDLESREDALQETRQSSMAQRAEIDRLGRYLERSDAAVEELRQRQGLLEAAGIAALVAVLTVACCWLVASRVHLDSGWRVILWGSGGVLWGEVSLWQLSRRVRKPSRSVARLVSMKGRLLTAVGAIALSILANWIWSQVSS